MSDINEESGITLSEFKAWLSGVEEMQDDDWAPTLTQWRRIRAKFFDIKQDTAAVTQRPPAMRGQQPYQQPQYVPSERPSMPQPPPPGLDNGQSGRAKTPDIDSSNGYQSSLA